MRSCYLKEVREINNDEAGGPEDDGYQAMAVLLASYRVGPNIRRVAKEAGMSRADVGRFARRYREQQIWIGPKIADPTDGDEEGSAGMGFILHSLVGAGLLEAVWEAER